MGANVNLYLMLDNSSNIDGKHRNKTLQACSTRIPTQLHCNHLQCKHPTPNDLTCLLNWSCVETQVAKPVMGQHYLDMLEVPFSCTKHQIYTKINNSLKKISQI